MVSFTPQPFYSRANGPQYLLYMWLVGPQRWCGRTEGKFLASVEIEHRFLGRPARTLVIILIELSGSRLFPSTGQYCTSQQCLRKTKTEYSGLNIITNMAPTTPQGSTLTRVCVIIDGVWIGDWIY
jgi:hypothetical protein